MKQVFLVFLLLLLPNIAFAQSHRVCPAGTVVNGSKGPPDDCISAGSAAINPYVGPLSITGNQTNGSDQINKLCVNGVCPVTAFGAIGDCTATGSTAGCTNNHDAIQMAIDAAYTVGKPVSFPPNPAATGQTVYYSTTTLNPKGVSMFGGSGMGVRVSSIYPQVAVRGAPSLDVFAVGDPTVGGYVAPRPGFVIQDLGLIVNDSVDASTSFTGRQPGKTCQDVTLTSTSAAIASAAQCLFNQGDVGQNVTCTDSTNVLTTTILSVQSAAAATLASTWGFTTHAASKCYIAPMGLSVAQTIGNCAFAYDGASGASTSAPVNGATFRNMVISTTSGADQNNVCGFLFQGNQELYNDTFDHIQDRTMWGFAAIPANTNVSSALWAGMGDLNTFQHMTWDTNYPFIAYNGQYNHILDQQAGNDWYGPQFLSSFSTSETQPVFLNVANFEFETVSNANHGGWRIEGRDDNISQSILTTNQGTPAQWDAVGSKCLSCQAPNGTLNITGVLNEIQLSDLIDSTTITDTGLGNICSLGRQANPPQSTEPPRYKACGTVNSRQQFAFAHTPDFIALGNETTPFNNLADQWIWPQDSYGASGVKPAVVGDATSLTGAYWVNPASGGFSINNIDGVALVIGTHIPATKIHVCAYMKALAGTPTQTFVTKGNGSTLLTLTPTLSTSYSTTCGDADFTGLTGDAAVFQFNTPASEVDVGGISVRPFASRLQTAPTTFAGAGTCSAAAEGSQYFITDDNAACTFATIATGSGSTPCRIGCDGTNWRAGY